MKNTYDPDDRNLPDLPGDDDSMSSSPIGRLMSDETEVVAEEDASLVSGFDRSKAEADEPPPPMERRRPKRERPDPDADEDFFEAGIRDASTGRERGRRRQPNPDPRPAARATVPTHKRMAAPRRNEDEFHPLDMPPEDKYDTFRQRYNPKELISSGQGSRGSRPPRKGAPPTRDGAPRRSDGGEDLNLLRYVTLAGVLVLLIVLVLMTVSRNRLTRELEDARETIDSMQDAYARTNSLIRENEELEAQTLADAIRIEELEAQLGVQNGDEEGEYPLLLQQPDDPTTAGEETSATASLGDFPRQHVVLRGQNLTTIARMHYGDGTASENYARAIFIANYNDLDPNNVPADTVLTIPPLP